MNLHSMQSLFFLSKSQKRDSSGVHISERNGFRKLTLSEANVSWCLWSVALAHECTSGMESRVSIGGNVYQPADDTSKGDFASGSRTIEDLSRRLIEQARDCADAYVTDYEGVKRLLDTHEGRRRTARRAEQEERRAKANMQRRQLKGANIFIQRPQRPWHATNSPGGSIDFAGGIPSLPPIGHVPWTAAAKRDEERGSPQIRNIGSALPGFTHVLIGEDHCLFKA